MYQVQIELHENGTVSALPPEHGCGGTRTGRLEMTSSCLVRQLTAGQTMPSTARRSFIADRGREDVRDVVRVQHGLRDESLVLVRVGGDDDWGGHCRAVRGRGEG